MLDLLMGLGAPGSDVRTPAADGRHDVQLLGNLLKGGDFWEPVERVDYSLFVGHGQKISLRGFKGKRRIATANWLGLCPDNRITGGKILSSRTRAVKSRVATALRLAAQSLWRAQNYFGDLYRRWKARLGNQKAVTAMAHKLARVLWHLLKYKQAFDWKVFEKEEAKMKRKKLKRLHHLAASMNLQLVPLQ